MRELVRMVLLVAFAGLPTRGLAVEMSLNIARFLEEKSSDADAWGSRYDFEKDGILYLIERDDRDVVRVVDSKWQFYGIEGNFMMDCRSYWCDVEHGEDYAGDLVIPETVEYEGKTYTVGGIGWGAFNHCKDLISVEIPNTVKWMWDGTFYHCQNLEWVKLSENITYIPSEAFAKCTSLKSLDLTYVEMLGVEIVLDNPSLEEVILPCIYTPGNYWFNHFPGLDNVKRFYATSAEPLEILDPRDGFRDNNYLKATLYVPKGSGEAYRQAPVWELFENIVEMDSNSGVIQSDMPEVFTLSGRTLSAHGSDVNVYTPGGSLVKSVHDGENVRLGHGIYVAKSGAVVKKLYVK